MKSPFSFAVLLALLIIVVSMISMTMDHPASSDVTSELAISWQKIAETPPAAGQQTSLGVSGAFAGVLGNTIILAGGTNFPEGHPFFDGASKRFYQEVFLLQPAANQLTHQKTVMLPQPLAYGATVQLDDKLYFVGGVNAQGAQSMVYQLSLDETGEPVILALGQLPFGWSDGAAAFYADKLYLFGGKINGQATNRVLELTREQTGFIETDYRNQIPGAQQRESFPFYQSGSELYLFGGIDSAPQNGDYVLTDAHLFDFSSKNWVKSVAPVTMHGKPFGVGGGAVVALNDDQLLLLGGVNRDVFNQALQALNSLQGDALTAFKAEYFSRSVEQFNFSRQQLIYSRRTNRWTVLEQPVPFSGGAGPIQAVVLNQQIYWLNGEIKPVVRTADIYRGTVTMSP